MEAALINQFLASTQLVLREYFDVQIISSAVPRAVKSAEPLEPLTVIIGFTGDLEGHLLVGYSAHSALNIARAMIRNPEYEQLDELCVSALSELTNMVAGTTATKLAGLGYCCNLHPPALLQAGQPAPQLLVPVLICMVLNTNCGSISIYIGVQASTA